MVVSRRLLLIGLFLVFLFQLGVYVPRASGVSSATAIYNVSGIFNCGAPFEGCGTETVVFGNIAIFYFGTENNVSFNSFLPTTFGSITVSCSFGAPSLGAPALGAPALPAPCPVTAIPSGLSLTITVQQVFPSPVSGNFPTATITGVVSGVTGGAMVNFSQPALTAPANLTYAICGPLPLVDPADVACPMCNPGETQIPGYIIDNASPPAPPVITTSALPNGQPNSSYSTTLQATGVLTPLFWAATGLPAGIGISSANGLISGTTSQTGAFSVGSSAKDCLGRTASRTLPLLITNIQITGPASLPVGTQGVSYSQAFTTSGDVPPNSWTLATGTLPTGLTLNPSTGLLSGIPMAIGFYPIAVRVTDSLGAVATRDYSLFINPAPLTITTLTLPNGMIGQNYSQQLLAAGGVLPYTWSLASGTLPTGVMLNPMTGLLSGNPLAEGTFNFVIRVSDSDNVQTTTRNYSVVIAPRAPQITTATLPAAIAGQQYTQTLQATGGTPPYTWSVAAGALPTSVTLDPATGVLTGIPPFPGTFNFTARATDTLNAQGTRALTLVVNAAPLQITTLALDDGVVGRLYSHQFQAFGGLPPYSWSFSGALPEGLSFSSDGTLSGTPTQAGAFPITVRVADSTAPVPTAVSRQYTLTIHTLEIQSPATLPSATVGQSYLQAFSAIFGIAPFTWTISAGAPPRGVSLNPSTGALTGIPLDPGSFNLTVKVTDAFGSTATRDYTLRVSAGPLKIDTAGLNNGSLGALYSQQLLASGGVPPYQWMATTALPQGLSLSPAGLLSGTPAQTSATQVTVKVTDAAGASVTANFPLTIGPRVLTVATTALPAGTVGQAYTFTLTGINGSTPYRWAAAALPQGLSIDAATGIVSGTPGQGGVTTVTITLTDAANATATAQLPLAINPAPLQILTNALPNGTVGQSYNTTLTAMGGTMPYSWTATGLPGGITLNAATGVLSGTPGLAGSYTVAIQATDNAQKVAQGSLTLTVNQAGFTIQTASLPNGAVGQTYSQQIVAVGGVLPYVFTAASMPPGLTLSTTGLVSGIPTQAGQFTIPVTAGDAALATAFKNVAITIGPGSLTITTTSLSGGLGQLFQQTLTAVAGQQPYTWSVSGLPPGLVLNLSTGVVSGTPSLAGTFTASVTVRDALNAAATANVVFNIAADILRIVFPDTLLNGTTAAIYQVQFGATGGRPPYTWTLSQGIPGVSINSSTGLMSGLPTAPGVFAVAVTVTDASVPALSATRVYFVTITTSSTLQIGVSALPAGTIGTTYSQTIPVTGGIPPYVFTTTGAGIPGLTLSAGGVLGGMPTQTGTFTLTVIVTDNVGTRVTGPVTVVIGGTALSIPSATLPPGAQGNTYTQTLTATGGLPPYTWTALSALPGGLTLASNGTITGTPLQPGTFTINVRATDSAGQQATRQVTLNVATPLLSTPPSVPPAIVGDSYSSTLASSGGAAPFTWKVTSGALPAGLTLSPSGVLTGTPEVAGTFTVTLMVTDAAGQSAMFNLTFMVRAGLALSGSSLPGGILGSTYSTTLTASGGQPPYTFAALGPLPNGLTLDPTGVISGNPAQPGRYEINVQVTDSQGRIATQVYSIVVQPAPIRFLTENPLPAGAAGSPYSLAFTGAGGQPPYQWTVAAGSLPPGLTLDPGTGAISGAPTGFGTFQFTVRLTDSAQTTSTSPYTITVPAVQVTGLQITGINPSGAPATQQMAGAQIDRAYPLPITGTLTLLFIPDSGFGDPAVVFANGRTSVDFEIATGSTQARFQDLPGLQTGTVAGNIRLTITLRSGGVDITPSPAPSQQIRVAPAAPVIRTVTATRTASGVELRIVGYSTTRELTSVRVSFTSAPGSNVQTTEFTIQTGPQFVAWYQSEDSRQYGSQFTLTLPFGIQGTTTSVTGASVTLINGAGSSAAMTATFQ